MTLEVLDPNLENHLFNPTISTGQYSRREVVRGGLSILAIAALLGGCARPTPVPNQPEVRRRVGVWSKDDIDRVSRAMVAEDQYRYIARTGRLLADSWTGGNTIPTDYPLFINHPIQIETMPGPLQLSENTVGLVPNDAPMGATIHHEEPYLRAILPGRGVLPDLPVTGGSSLRLDQIRISAPALEGKSDFLLKLFLAKEVEHFSAFTIAIESLYPNAYEGYDIPADELSKRAMKTASVGRRLPDDVPLYSIADLWAHFLILPDYLLARDRGKLTGEDLKGTWILDTAAKLMEEDQVLTRREDGRYGWVQDQRKLLETWYKVASSAHQVFFEGQ